MVYVIILEIPLNYYYCHRVLQIRTTVLFVWSYTLITMSLEYYHAGRIMHRTACVCASIHVHVHVCVHVKV